MRRLLPILLASVLACLPVAAADKPISERTLKWIILPTKDTHTFGELLAEFASELNRRYPGEMKILCDTEVASIPYHMDAPAEPAPAVGGSSTLGDLLVDLFIRIKASHGVELCVEYGDNVAMIYSGSWKDGTRGVPDRPRIYKATKPN